MKKLFLGFIIGIFLIFNVSALWTLDLNDGLISYYAMNDSSGTNLLDSTPNQYNGTLVNTPTWNDGKIGNGLSFLNTSTEYVNISRGPLFNTQLTSISFWIKPTQTASSVAGDNEYIFATAYGGGNGYIFFYSGADGTNRFTIYAGGSTIITIAKTDPNIPNWYKKDQWAYISLNMNSSGVNNMSVFSPSGNANYSSTTTWTPFNSQYLILGATGELDANYYFNGTLDEFMIKNKSLSYAQALKTYTEAITYTTIFPPVVTLNSPVDLTNSTTHEFTFNGSVSTDYTLSNVSLILDGIYNTTNTSGIEGNYIFTKNLGVGIHNWTIQGCDTSGLCANGTTRFFNVSNYALNSEEYNPTTAKTFSEEFSINISLEELTSLSSAYLVYNGTSYLGSLISSGSTRIINRTITIPDVSSQYNASFFWTLNLNNGTSIQVNTTTHNQTINTLEIDSCSVNTHYLLNYSIYDEDTRLFRTNSTYNISSNVYVKLSGDFSGEEYSYYSGTLNNNPLLICVDNELITGHNYRLDSIIQFTASDYVTEYHYIENYTLNISAAPRNISLYLLATNNSQEFLITYKNKYLTPVEGAIIELTRQYPELGPNEFVSVENMKTDTDGKTIGHFVLNDVIYRVYVTLNGELVATFQDVRAFCSDVTTGNCNIFLNEKSSTSNPQSYTNYLNVIGTQEYNSTSKIFSFDFTTTDGTSKNINLTLYNINNSIIQSVICTGETTSSAGTLTCTIPSAYYNSTALVKILVDDEVYNSHILDIKGSYSSEISVGRYLLAFFLIITLPLIALGSGPMTLIFLVVGFIAAVGLFLIDLGGFLGPFSAFLWLVVVVVILLIKSASRRQQQ